MLSKLVLFASAGGLMRGYINLRSEKIFQQIFKDVEKMPIYNLDYLQSLQDIPTNKFILLCGKAIPHEQVTYPQPISNPRQSILLRSIIANRVLKQGEKVLGNIWKVKSQGALNFVLSGGSNDEIQVRVVSPSRPEIYLFALQELRNDITLKEITSQRDQQQISFMDRTMRTEVKFKECVILPGKYYVLCGKLEMNGPNPQIAPIIVMGDNKEAFLDSLDATLMETSKKVKQSFIFSLSTLTVFFIFSYAIKQEYQKRRQAKILSRQPQNTTEQNSDSTEQ